MKLDNSKFDKEGNLKNGLHQDTFKDGSVAAEGIFKDGERVDEWKYYLLNGQLRAIGIYIKGKMSGEWKWYHENGNLMQVGTFDDNELKTGLWIRYHKNGNLWDETEYLAGKKTGTISTYDQDGKLLSQKTAKSRK